MRDRLIEMGLATGANKYPGPFSRIGCGDGPADTAAAAGNHRRLAG
jgi:hypothetical protein